MAGFSLNYLSQALSTFAMIGFLKRNFPKLPMVLGGGLVSSWVRRPGWQNPFSGLVDCLVAGPGEIPLLSLLGIREAPAEIQGRPDYDGFSINDYLAPGFILPYSSSSGCYWNRCLFCPEKAEKNPYQPTPLGRAVEDLAALTAQKRPVLVHFLDNAISPALMHKDNQPSPRRALVWFCQNHGPSGRSGFLPSPEKIGLRDAPGWSGVWRPGSARSTPKRD